MFMPTSDYTQQLLAYLQAWRQLLEQWTGMAAGVPFPTLPFAMPAAPFMPPAGQFVPPTMPFVPPAVPFVPPAAPFVPPPTAAGAPTPPAPADYTQQLFSYLAAWRQYLEQMTGAAPGSPQAPTAQAPAAQAPAEPADGGGAASHTRPPDVPIPPPDEAGSRGPVDTARTEPSPTWPPRLVDIEPGSYGGSQVVSTDVAGAADPFGPRLDVPEVLSPPEYDFGYQFDGPRRRTTAGAAAASVVPVRATPEAATQLPITGTPFRSAIERAQATLGTLGEIRETPSP